MIDIIRVDHEALAQISGRFNQQSEAIELMLYAMRGTMQPLASGGWIGQGADAFFAEMNSDILPAVQRLTDALAQAGIVTMQLSDLMQQADEEASFSFKDGGGRISGRMTGGGSAGGSGGIGIGIGGGGGNSYTVPSDWLDGVTDSFGGGTTGNQGDYGIPRDWLDGVRDPAGGEAGAGSGSTGGSGSGSGGGSSSGGESASEPADSASTGGGSGGGSSQMDVSDPYGQSGAENGSSFRSVGATGEATVQSGGLTYQSLAGASSGGGGTAPAVRAVGGGAVPTAAIEQSGGDGLPFGLAAATPFLALLGKATKDQMDGD